MIIDAHCHVWPDDIAARVLSAKPVGLEPLHDGTLDGLRRTMDNAEIDRAMCLAIAAKPSAIEKTNEFIGSVDRQRFIPFGTVHPDISIEKNLKSLRDNGIVGVKLHPLFQDISFDDQRVVDLLHGLADEGVIVITHAGAGADEAANARGAPRLLRNAIDAVPNLTILACHFGGYHCLDEAEDSIVTSRAFLETSWPPRLSDLDQEKVKRIIRRHGAERVIFGSDWPMSDPASEIATIKALHLEKDEEAGILGNNLARLLNLM